ncbi:FAD-binding and (Fe-S)-binding domain-containing protein [Microbacterium sp. PRC9]|uniref:FAD-binding and (Fe-S)-binding domain-containing protein n=1 Tax=Microbacterium sp. PRC9 TaxID=2962591 RepID=UPI0028820D41|nr:FAD-binding and (Fe-S)-binding domain-containing protein [Microbacterium sp. PRC9]MDT0144567.1 FAD-binding and (Fe-S)-binding domain-containing protein [Microbacterium sp. PRC9]
MSPTDTLAPVDAGLLAALSEACSTIGARATDRLAGSHDASHYQLTPRAVATARDAAEVGRLLATARDRGLPVTFRSGGTSLSGQAGTDGILIDTRKNFRRIDVFDDGRRARVQPGATMRAVNARLARHGTKLGPDPASEIACTIGGVVANNSSGMSCGTHANTYQTLESAVLVLASGTVLDTGAPDAAEILREREPEIYAGLERLRDRVRENSDSVATLRRLHAIKNTMGYGLNSFLDHTNPVDILEHLVIGSEGTLAFVAEATFRTLPVKPHLATGLLIFASLADATASLPALVEAGFATIELMDAASLRVAQRDPEATADLTGLVVVDHAALLVEFQEDTLESLDARVAAASGLLTALPLVTPAVLTTDAATRAHLWHIRKGLFAAVAGARPSGTTALLEDIAVPVERLNETCTQLIGLFDTYAYEGSVIFGHAKDGNIHFLINERFDDADKFARYQAFTEEMVSLVLAHGGTLKAEHGTGRIMAPFVRRQYGDELYEVMWEVKRLLDPGMLLNPGVLLTDDPLAHTKNLKTAPTVEAEVDRCVECGYCEPVCPSRDLTLTPRERIVMRRELQRARDRGDEKLAKILEKEYGYDGVQTCAVDGMCQTACPVLINTGDLVRRLRAENQKTVMRAGWKAAAKQWDAVSSVGGVALSLADAMPVALPNLATKIGRGLLGPDTLPLYTADLPGGGKRRKVFAQPEAVAVYFSSCTTTMFGPVGQDGVAESFLRLCERAGVNLRTPDDLPGLCCGTPWKSKGLTDGYAVMKAKVAASLVLATENGRLPVVCDASSCTEGLEILLEAAGQHDIRVIDAVAFVDEHVLPHLPAGERVASLTLHPTCSSAHLGINPALSRVAAAAADTVVIPEDWGCCAFAGDRGMLHPELTASATAPGSDNVAAAASDVHASLNRTCEMGMTRATGQPYRHILQVLDDAVREAMP